MPATQSVEPAATAAPFEPPFRGRTADDILLELGLPDAAPATLVRRLAFAVEIGDYPYIDGLLGRERTTSSDAPAVTEALSRFRECADQARRHEETHGAGSARNLSHRFWPDVWERNNRLRAQGHRLGVDRLIPRNQSSCP